MIFIPVVVPQAGFSRIFWLGVILTTKCDSVVHGRC